MDTGSALVSQDQQLEDVHQKCCPLLPYVIDGNCRHSELGAGETVRLLESRGQTIIDQDGLLAVSDISIL